MTAQRVRLALGAAVALGALAACRASVRGDASAQVTADGADAELDAELRQERAFAPDVEQGTEIDNAGDGPLLGARRDLTLVPDRASLACSCLKVALGSPSEPAFRWKEAPPRINPETQLVVGLTSEGMSCDHPKGSRGASYWGYRQSGNDVIVFVESAIKNRPLTFGAIIPKPLEGGKVYAAPAFKHEPYGRGSDGAPRCELGNPGPPRSASPPPPGDGEG